MSENHSDLQYQFGDFRFDAGRRVLWKNGEVVPLPPRATDVLAVLVKDHGQLVEREQLLKSAWPDSFVEPGNLNNAISSLRKILGGKQVIQTVSRRGYRFTAETVELSNRRPSSESELSNWDHVDRSALRDATELVIEKHTVSHSVVKTVTETVGAKDQIQQQIASGPGRTISGRLIRIAVCAIVPVLLLAAWLYMRPEQRASSASSRANFENGGIALTDFGFADERAQAIALQADGKMVVAGWAGDTLASADIAIARYEPDGSLDVSFDGDGKLITHLGDHTDMVYGLAIQPDGKIIAVGTNFTGSRSRRFAILRYKPDGALDASFDGDGIALLDIGDSEQDTANAVVICEDGSILVAGSALNSVETNSARLIQNDFAIIRLTPSGRLDTNFGNGGKVITDFGKGSDVAYALLQQPDGKVLVAGMTAGDKMQDWGLARYLEDGTLDSSFGSGGKFATNFLGEDNIPWSLALQPDGKFIAAGYALKDGIPRFAVSRHSTDGSFDNTFGSGGKATFTIKEAGVGREVFLLADGRIIVAGRAGFTAETSFGVAVLSSDGTLVESFHKEQSDDAGKQVPIEVHGAVMTNDGSLVLAGGTKDGKKSDFALARIN